ncbi:MAG: GWxTD domain-containing protein [Bacteroidetes bacterium]|nr:GWxTD domain-containing protein [Bacteroidota bacterium]MBU1115970.1 GWxTD domain-containing protein [Bacteroidota bacterium]MBU1798433.1 GWxTD domain-containing protein [Bacteroidota bacterium]
MKKIILFTLFLSVQIFSQDNISFEFDYAKFKFDSTKTYLELYYSFGQNTLTQFKEEDKIFVGAYLDVVIIDTITNTTLVDNRYISKTEIQNNDSTYKMKSSIGNLGFILNSGTYLFLISGTDIADTNRTLAHKEVITIKEYQEDKYAISDIQLATRIISDSKNVKSIFYKNTMEVFPNPHNIYSEKMPILFYYAELYNLNLPEFQDRDLILIQQLNDNYGKSLEVKNKVLQKNNSSIVEAGVINLKKYPTGSYTVVLSIFEDSVQVGISSAKRFYLVNQSVQQNNNTSISNMDVKSSEFGILSEEECDDLFDVSDPIARKGDADSYAKLQNLESKRKYLFDFWKVRDQIPETSKNEFKEEYLNRVKYVDERYRTFVRRGAKTDRGRIYLQYGEPDEIDNYPSEYNMKPYEIWNYYSIEGGVLFIFGDVTGYNNYELLNSTKRGELRDDLWQRRITVD